MAIEVRKLGSGGVLAGLRISEVQALKWDAIDFDSLQIWIRAAYNGKEKRLQDHPKQEDWGQAPMAPQLVEYLLQRRGGLSDFVVRGKRGGMLSYNAASDGLKRLCKDAGVPAMQLHELRHSCSEVWVEAGATAEDVRRVLNQKSLTATANYMHRTDDRLQRLAGQVMSPSAPSKSRGPA